MIRSNKALVIIIDTIHHPNKKLTETCRYAQNENNSKNTAKFAANMILVLLFFVSTLSAHCEMLLLLKQINFFESFFW